MAHAIHSSCTRCGACLTECPTQSIIAGLKQYHIDADTCDDAACCVGVCPVEAIKPLPVEAGADAGEDALFEGKDA